MNVTCPQCATVFRVDPAKVPERGVRARCSVCAGLIAVRRPPVAAPATPRQPIPAMVAVEPPVVRLSPAATFAAPPPRPAPVTVAVEPPAPVRIAVEPPAPVAAPVIEVAIEPPPPKPEPVAIPISPPAVPISALPQATTPPSGPQAPAAHQSTFSNPFLQQDPGTRARRLARALISDLVVYHPEKRQRGLADGNLKELFAEEIRKSWEEYTEQVGDEIASSTAFFTEALNEILSEGRQLFG